MDSDDLVIRRKGRFATDNVGPAFIRLFRKGQILYGSRRTYLRKVAVADFDGVTANTTFVLESRDSNILLQELLPYLMLSESFTTWSIAKSRGSTNPYVLFSDLADYEFDLPDLPVQRKLADRFALLSSTKDAYNRLLASIDELVKSQFVEMFGDPVENPKGWEVRKLGDLVSFETSGSRGWAKYYSEEGELFITIKNVRGGKISLDDIQHIHPPRDAEAERTRVQEGDLLISITADLGRTGIVTKEIADAGAYVNQHLICLRLRQAKLLPLFASHFLESPAGKQQFSAKNRSAVKAGLNFDSIRDIEIYLPPLDLQNRFAVFVGAADKSKFAARQSLERLDAVYRALSKETFG